MILDSWNRVWTTVTNGPPDPVAPYDPTEAIYLICGPIHTPDWPCWTMTALEDNGPAHHSDNLYGKYLLKRSSAQQGAWRAKTRKLVKGAGPAIEFARKLLGGSINEMPDQGTFQTTGLAWDKTDQLMINGNGIGGSNWWVQIVRVDVVLDQDRPPLGPDPASS